jgi:preprotein translocase subunit SecE
MISRKEWLTATVFVLIYIVLLVLFALFMNFS